MPVPIPTIDAHHHLWDLAANRYPWLTGPPVAAHFGPYDRIRKNYLIGDYLADVRGQSIVKSVHVEAGCDPADPVAETRWLQVVADTHGFPHGIVTYADLSTPDARAALEGHCAHRNVRGVRVMMRRLGELARRKVSGDSLMTDPAWRRGFALLREFHLSFDLQAPPPLMAEAADLAAAFPDIQFLLTHAGLPLDRSEEGMAAWRRGMALLAERPNVAVKISGLPMTDWHWSTDSLRPIVLQAIDLFGVDRAMFGSNFPVDKLFSDFDTLFDVYRAIVAGFTAEERQKLFHDNAERLYRL